MQKKYELKDRVMYGELNGFVDRINLKEKEIGCIFKNTDHREVYVKFDLEGFIKPAGRFLNYPRLVKQGA